MGAPIRAAESLESTSRQLQYALEQSATMEEAFQKLYAAADPPQRASVQQLEHLLQTPEAADLESGPGSLSSYPTLVWLLRQSGASAKSAAALFREYRRHEAFRATALVAVWSEFNASLAYLGLVLGVLVAVTSMYRFFVLAGFESLYRGFGIDLPTLTRFAFGGGAPVLALLLLFALALIVFLLWFVGLLRQRLRRYAPMPSRYERIPLVGPVACAYHEYLRLSYAAVLRAAGLPAAEALRRAETRVGSRASGPSLDLSMAERLGRLDEEMHFQQEASADRLLLALARCRRRARIVLSILIYYLVASFVSAMYLPIFSLGSAI